MHRQTVFVAKIGGSLLDVSDLPDRLRAWREDVAPCHMVFVVGGGQLVDSIRSLYSHRPWREDEAHWLCVDLLSVTTQVVANWLPEWPIADRLDQLRQRLDSNSATLFVPAHFLRCLAHQGIDRALPPTWDVTSDSIAGRLAIELSADELFLLKSCLPAGQATNLDAWVDAGFVDSFFPRLASELPPCTAVDMRSADRWQGRHLALDRAAQTEKS